MPEHPVSSILLEFVSKADVEDKRLVITGDRFVETSIENVVHSAAGIDLRLRPCKRRIEGQPARIEFGYLGLQRLIPAVVQRRPNERDGPAELRERTQRLRQRRAERESRVRNVEAVLLRSARGKG